MRLFKGWHTAFYHGEWRARSVERELTVIRRRPYQLHLALYPVETTLTITVAVQLRLGRCLSPTTPVRDQLRPQQVIGQQQALAQIGL